MRSLFAKILLWFLATIFVTSTVSVLVSIASTRGWDNPFVRFQSFALAESRNAWEQQGAAGLRRFQDQFFHESGMHVVLTGQDKRDVLTREDYSGRIRPPSPPLFGMPWLRPPHQYIARRSPDGRYWSVVFVPRTGPQESSLLSRILWMLPVIALLCYALARHLTSPLRKLEKTLDRFGRGDFTARVESTRRDELGRLARTFDQMAERIQTLMQAERRLLMDISHELRSPLTRLGLAVDLARSGGDRTIAFNRIQKEADRLNELVGELLQVTRAEGDPSSLNLEPVALDQLVQEITADAAVEASARGCRLAIETDRVQASGDEELLRRAIENLIRNAVRYAPPDSTVEVKLQASGDEARLTVRDYGTGVPESELNRIFEPFYRVEKDRNRASGGGVGLGLSIARRAIELHRGRVRAHNAHPGLMVELEIPALQEALAPRA